MNVQTSSIYFHLENPLCVSIEADDDQGVKEPTRFPRSVSMSSQTPGSAMAQDAAQMAAGRGNDLMQLVLKFP